MDTGEGNMKRTFHRGDHVELASALLEEIGAGDAYNVVSDLGKLHAYDAAAGIWRPIDMTEQSRIVQSFAGSPVGDKGHPLRVSSGDVWGATRLATDRVAEPGFFARRTTGVCFADGFTEVTADGVRLRPHARDHRCRYALPFGYSEATSPRWEAFLAGLFRDDDDGADKIAFLGEFFGASLLGIATLYQKCVVAKGPGGNGKSALVNTVSAAFPADSITSIAPQEMSDEYSRALLAGKRLNVVSELPEASIIASEAFKAIIVGDVIKGRPIREAPFTFSPEAGHYFAANRLPGTNDQSQAFWDRIAVVEFNRAFRGDPEQDPNVVARLVEQDLPAIVAWSLQGAVRLLKSDRYTLPASHGRALEEWRQASDSVATFLKERTEPAPEGKVYALALYTSFTEWARLSGHRNVPSNTTFGRRVKALGVQYGDDGRVYYKLTLHPGAF